MIVLTEKAARGFHDSLNVRDLLGVMVRMLDYDVLSIFVPESGHCAAP